MVIAKAVSSLEKAMLGSSAADFPQLKSLKAARGERVSFQLLLSSPDYKGTVLKMSVRSPLLSSISVFRVGNVPVELPAFLDNCDDDYLSLTPGIFPDVLTPVKRSDPVVVKRFTLSALWFTIEVPEETEPGVYPVSITLTNRGDGSKTRVRVSVEVKNTVIQKNDLIYTEWFHCDSIADYFGVKMMSERHWRLIERFIKTAAHTGITMLLTPIFTPPLDTAVGAERPTMQLVTITEADGKYKFDYTLLDRWVELCRKYGIQYFEMAHLFTQWGAEHCPKIIVNGVRRFGWDTDALSEEYKQFLSQFLPSLTKHLKKLGIADNCCFHISDEPRGVHIENYAAAKAVVKPLIPGFKIIDALSDPEYYDRGIVDCPVPATNKIEPFLERDIKERWCYYCCSQGNLVANRFIAMPSYRTRITGVQLYIGDMSGFLQWGFNFYYSELARKKIDPYKTTDGNQSWQAGDPFTVYPYKNGAIESIRAVVFYSGLQDRMLLKQLEEKIGRKKVLDFIEKTAGAKITFKEYPRNSEFLPALHDAVLDMLG